MEFLYKNRKFLIIGIIIIFAFAIIVPLLYKSLMEHRAEAFSKDANDLLAIVKNDINKNNYFVTGTASADCSDHQCVYTPDDIEKITGKKLKKSSYRKPYECVAILVNRQFKTYTMTMIDAGGHGFSMLDSTQISPDAVDYSGKVRCEG